MKVIGTGAPRMLTIRFEPCELDVLRDELEQRRAVAVEAAAHAQREAKAARPALPVAERPRGELECRHDELLLVSELLDELRRPAPEPGPREVVGPTWLLGDVIRGAADETVERLAQGVAQFRLDRGHPTPEELLAALATAAAWVRTLVGLDFADNHAVDC